MKRNKNTIRYRIITILLSFLLPVSLSVYSQDMARHEVSVWGAMGSSSLKADMMPKGTGKSKISGALGLGYGFNINNRWSIITGAEMMPYSNNVEFVSISDQYDSPWGENQGFNMAYYKEKVDVRLLNIPLMVQLRATVDNQQFYLGLGGKLGLPMSPTSASEESSFISREGLIPINVLYKKPAVDHALELNMAYMLALETGIGWRLSDKWLLQTGVFLDYGLNNILKQEAGQRLVQVGENIGEFQYNSVLTSQYYNTVKAKDEYFVSKMAPLSFGLKVKLSFSIGGSNSSYGGNSSKINYDNYSRHNAGRGNSDWFEEYFKSKGYETQEEMRKLDLPTIYRKVQEREAKTMDMSKEKLEADYMSAEAKKKLEERKQEEEDEVEAQPKTESDQKQDKE